MLLINNNSKHKNSTWRSGDSAAAPRRTAGAGTAEEQRLYVSTIVRPAVHCARMTASLWPCWHRIDWQAGLTVCCRASGLGWVRHARAHGAFPATRSKRRPSARTLERVSLPYTIAFPADRSRAQEGSLHRSIASSHPRTLAPPPSSLHHYFVSRLPTSSPDYTCLSSRGKHARNPPPLHHETQRIAHGHANNTNHALSTSCHPFPHLVCITSRPCMEHIHTPAAAC